jgi:Fic family protein
MDNFHPGSYKQGYQYKYFVPSLINRSWNFRNNRILELLEQVSLSLGELNSYAKFVPDIGLFIQSYVTKEAVTSSRIEGTRTNIEEAFYDELDIDPEHRNDWIETKKYLEAMNFSLDALNHLPLSSRLLKETHSVLLSHVRGKTKNPGEFRTSQNWIGGASIKDAVFVPPSAEYVDDLMSDLEKFLHNEEISVPKIIRIAIAHYQFETIHPFLDGNGRIGRLLITLYLISAGLLDKPLLYTSDFFEKNKSLIYDKLTFCREKGDLEGWIVFFLNAVETTAKEAISSLSKIVELKDRLTKEKIIGLGKKAQKAQLLLDQLFRRPIINASEAEKLLSISPKTVNVLLRLFEEKQIIVEITGFKRNRIFAFREYLEILKK